MKSKVILIPCTTYDTEQIKAAISQAVELLGGWSTFVDFDSNILLKPNLLKKALPEQAITTHPTVFEGVIKSLQEAGAKHLSYGDSPGHGAFDKTAEDCGLQEVAKKYGVAEGDFLHSETVSCNGTVANQFVLCKAMREADSIINICKMKTHALERITGAVKNMYGAVYQLNKGLGHTKFPNPDVFASMLVDLNLLLKPKLHIMDGVVAMEGNGPASGTPVSMNVILVSADAIALDTVFCHLIYLDPALVPTNVAGQAAGYGTMNADEIEVFTVTGEQLSLSEVQKRFGHPDFDVYRDRARADSTGSMGMGTIVKLLDKRPAIDKNKCIKCGICVESCPLTPKAVTFSEKTGRKAAPSYDYNRCIRCFCCQEMCPKKAIYVKEPFLRRFFN